METLCFIKQVAAVKVHSPNVLKKVDFICG